MKQKYVRVGPKGKKVQKDLHDILQGHYVLDDKEGLCTVPFYFENFSDFFETRVGNKPILKGSLRESLEGLLTTVPECYDLLLDIEIENDEGHDEKEARAALLDGLFLNSIRYRKRLKGKSLLALVLLLGGILVLIAMALLETFLFKGEDNAGESIVIEILDIAASVFVWEAVTLYFIERSEDRIAWDRSKQRIREIRIRFEKGGRKKKDIHVEGILPERLS